MKQKHTTTANEMEALVLLSSGCRGKQRLLGALLWGRDMNPSAEVDPAYGRGVKKL